MNTDEKSKLAATAQGVVDLAAAAQKVDPQLAALSGVAIATFEFASATYTHYRKRRALAWWTDYVRYLGTMTSQGAVTDAALQANNDPEFEARVHDALNAVWSAVDEVVLPHLAYLAADYEATGRPVDLFFKRFARFLQDTDESELKRLTKLLAQLGPVFAGGAQAVALTPVEERTQLTVEDLATGNKFPNAATDVSTCMLLRRLLDGHLVDESNTIGDGTGIVLSQQTFDRISRYVAAPLI